MKCPNCGAEFDVKTIFCENCGVKIDYELMEKLEKEEKAAAKAEKENDVFYRAAKRQERKHSIIIAVFNFVLFALFFSNWFGSDLFDLFDGFGFNFFDAIGTVTGLSRLSYESGNGFFSIIKEIPAAMLIVVLCTLSAYVTSASALFASSIRIFANKTKASTQKVGLWAALISGALAYITLYAFQNGIDSELGSGVGSHLVSTSGWFFIFLITALILLVRTNKVVKDSDEDFTEKGKKTFDIVTKIYNVCIILGLLFGIGIISLPTINLPEKEVKETKTYTNLYDAARDMPENQNNNYNYDFEYDYNTGEKKFTNLYDAAKSMPENQNNNYDYDYYPGYDYDYGYEDNYNNDTTTKEFIVDTDPDRARDYDVFETSTEGVQTWEASGLNYSDYYSGQTYTFNPDTWGFFLDTPVMSERRFDYNVDQEEIDISDILAKYPTFGEGKEYHFAIEDGNLILYYKSGEPDSVEERYYFMASDIYWLFGFDSYEYYNIVAMFFKDYIDVNGNIIVDQPFGGEFDDYETMTKTLILTLSYSEGTTFVIPEGVETIGRLCFMDKNFTDVIAPMSLKNLDSKAFYNSSVRVLVCNDFYSYDDTFEGSYFDVQ